MISRDRLDEILDRHAYLEARLAEATDPAELAALGRDHAALRPVVEVIGAWQRLQGELSEARVLREDPEMAGLAAEEIARIEARMPEAEEAVRRALIPKDAADARPAILEIRPGTGGEEAALFAAALFAMYVRYAERRGWAVEVLDETRTERGGLKDLVAVIRGEGAFARLKYESGVHRVQRVPETESGGRIHTSAATVAVLPEAEAVDIDIAPGDIRVDTMRASGAGGQHVNTTDSAVRITHLPTGIVAISSQKSQHANRARAMEVLRARLLDRARRSADAERAADRKAQVGSGDRSERIRTYNFPQGRVTDHRINLTLYRLDQVLGGDLDEIVDALTEADEAAKLADMA